MVTGSRFGLLIWGVPPTPPMPTYGSVRATFQLEKFSGWPISTVREATRAKCACHFYSSRHRRTDALGHTGLRYQFCPLLSPKGRALNHFSICSHFPPIKQQHQTKRVVNPYHDKRKQPVEGKIYTSDSHHHFRFTRQIHILQKKMYV